MAAAPPPTIYIPKADTRGLAVVLTEDNFEDL
jgi:hypothetical protein